MVVTRKTNPAGVIVAAVACGALATGLFGCSSSGGETKRPPTTSAPSGRSPFTGLPAPDGRVLAVKIDNVAPARPHTGLGAADIIYVEQVEGGQSRILAVFSSRLPPKVGPVRSARESDMELLRQFGRPALAYSGSQSALKPLIDAAPLFPLLPDDAPRAFFRDSARAAPHNLYVRPGAALAAAPKADKARDIGFRFGAAPAGGERRNEYTVRFPAARFSFTWSAPEKRWLVSMDGSSARTTDGGRMGSPTVVIQKVDVHASKFHDRWGSVSPFTETVGSGTALVLRDGRSHDARWSRATAQRGTSFTTPDGKPMTFAPGQVWVLLTAK